MASMKKRLATNREHEVSSREVAIRLSGASVGAGKAALRKINPLPRKIRVSTNLRRPYTLNVNVDVDSHNVCLTGKRNGKPGTVLARQNQALRSPKTAAASNCIDTVPLQYRYRTDKVSTQYQYCIETVSILLVLFGPHFVRNKKHWKIKMFAVGLHLLPTWSPLSPTRPPHRPQFFL